jgi:hypothetical protein
MAFRLSFVFLSTALIYGLLAPPALAAKCDVNLCISTCQKRGPQFGTGQACTSSCLQGIEERKKKGLCK